MKEIKDYLHLYLGCEVKIVRKIEEDFSEDDFVAPKLGEIGTLIMINDGMTINCGSESEEWNYGISFEKSKVALWDVKDFKPILRPLSDSTDMTEEERKEFNVIDDQFEQTRYLLSKHFDLFGLIEAGLAIDKSTLK